MRRLLLILGLALWAAPSLAREAYWIEPGYARYPLLGPAKAKGLVIWNNGVFGTQDTNGIPPPFIVTGLAVRGWDVIKLDRNPTYENTWINAGLRHVDRLIEEAEARRKAGYSRIILGGQSYGGAIALRAADTFPAYAVIALAPAIGQTTIGEMVTDQDSSAIERATYHHLEHLKAARAVLVMSPDDELTRGIDRSPRVREIMATTKTPYILVDRQVHGHGGAYTRAFIPYAACAVRFLDPGYTPKGDEFRCFHDEGPGIVAALGLDPAGASAGWFGYQDGSGQEVAVLERQEPNGITVDYGWGTGLLDKFPAGKALALPATRDGEALRFSTKAGATVVLRADGEFMKLSHTDAKSGITLTATLAPLDGGKLVADTGRE